MDGKDKFHKQEGNFINHKNEYSSLSKLQQHSISHCLPVIIRAAESLTETQDCQPLTVVDYGAADGFNSLPLIKACAGELHGDGPIRWIFNDFSDIDYETSLKELKVVLRDEGTACPVDLLFTPGTFYKQVAPTETVDFGLCLHALHWLSHRPPQNCNLIPYQPDDITKEILAQDWQDFLHNRSMELKPGGRLVLAIPTQEASPKDEGLPNGYGLIDGIREILQDMVDTCIITEEEYQSARVFPFSYRAEDDLRAPFRAGSKMHDSLRLIRLTSFDVSDNFYSDWIANGGNSNRSANKEYATELVMILKSFSDAVLGGLQSTRSEEDHKKILEIFYDKAKLLFEEDPQRFMVNLGLTIVEIIKP